MKYRWGENGRKLRGNALIIVAAAALLYLLCMGGIFVVGSRMEKTEKRPEIYGNLDERFLPTIAWQIGDQTYSYYESYFTNILVLGTDHDEISQDTLDNRGSQADFLMLLVIDRRNQTLTPIHIDRDTYTEVQVYGAFGHPAGSRDMQICLAHAFGGNENASSTNTVSAVSDLLAGVKVDYYLTMSMEGIAALNDALGGVTVTLEEDFTAIDPEMKAGSTLRLKGKQAEYYVRGRYGIGDYTNAQRMRHQESFIDAAIPLLRTGMKNDDEFIVELFEQMSAHLETNIPRTWLVNQAHVLADYAITPIRTLEGNHRIGADGFMEFHPDQEKLLEMVIDVFGATGVKQAG